MERLPTDNEDSDNETEKHPLELSECPECGGNITLNEQASELTCEDCGMVLADELIDHGPEWRSFDYEDKQNRARTGPPNTELRHDKGISAKIDWRNKDGYGRQLSPKQRERLDRLRFFDTALRKDSSNQSLINGNTEIQRMASALDVPKNIQETAGKLFRQAHKQELLPGRSIEAMATASLHIALRVHENPRPTGILASVSRADKKDVQRAARYMADELDMRLKPISARKYIPQFSSSLGVSSKTEQIATELFEDLSGTHHTSGNSPSVLAASAVYAATIIEGQLLTQQKVAEMTDITTVSIRKNYPTFLTEAKSSPLFGEDPDSLNSPRDISIQINDSAYYRKNGNGDRKDVAISQQESTYPYAYHNAEDVINNAPREPNPLKTHVPSITSTANELEKITGVIEIEDLSIDADSILSKNESEEYVERARQNLSESVSTLHPIIIDTTISFLGTVGLQIDGQTFRKFPSALGGAVYTASVLTEGIHNNTYSQGEIGDITDTSATTISNAYPYFFDVAIWLRENDPPYL